MELSNEQKLIIQEKGTAEQYWYRYMKGPKLEKFAKNMDVSHIGIYKNGVREEWGKMVRIL